MWKQYRRAGITEMMPWNFNLDMTGVSISEADRKAGSPTHGDWVARNSDNHADMWLVSAAFFKSAKFEPVS